MHVLVAHSRMSLMGFSSSSYITNTITNWQAQKEASNLMGHENYYSYCKPTLTPSLSQIRVHTHSQSRVHGNHVLLLPCMLTEDFMYQGCQAKAIQHH